MISLPGLTLTTQRFDIARSILSTFAQYADQGMLPNRFPDVGEAPEYNTVDATLWYIEAVRQYIEATGDRVFPQNNFPGARRYAGLVSKGHPIWNRHGFHRPSPPCR